MGQLLPQFRGGERVFFLRCQGVEKFSDLLLMDKFSPLIRGEKFIQVKGIVHCVLAGQVQPLLNALPDHAGELVGEHGQPGQCFIGIGVLAAPIRLGLLLIGVGPVENLLFGKLLAGKLLEGCAGQIQGVLPLDVTEGPLGLHGVHALLGLVHDQKVELQFAHPAQLIKIAAEIDGTFQPLQRLESNHIPGRCLFPMDDSGKMLFPRQDAGLVLQSVGVGHKGILAPPADELEEILRPRVGDAGPVGDDQHLGKAHLLD